MSTGTSVPHPRRLRPASADVVGTRADDGRPSGAMRKAALVVVSLDESLARGLVARLDRSDVDALNLELTRLSSIDPAEQEAALVDFAAATQARMRFVFDDVARLDDASIRAVYRDAEVLTWALALAGGSRGARTRVLDALEPRAAQVLSRTLAGLGPFRLEEVEAAQGELAGVLRATYEGRRVTDETTEPAIHPKQ